MAERPILFSAPMVRALMDGRKTMTRRVLKPQPNCLNGGLPLNDGRGSYSIEGGWKRYPIARGDRLWVREAWRLPNSFDEDSPVRAATRVHPSFKPNVFFEADGAVRSAGAATGKPGRLRASMHMPRWASRLTLTVTDVRVQRLQDISEEDARAEGAEHNGPCDHSRQSCADIGCFGPNSYRGGFAEVWWGINGVASWDANPWVAAYTFTVERRNIDAEVRHDL